jgi:hypothetical protein
MEVTMTTIEQWRSRRMLLEKQKFTPEEKARWADILHHTWHAIAGDVEQAMQEDGQRLTKGILVECVVDANRPMDYGMTREEYDFLSVVYSRPSGKRWLYKELNYV